jgi:hypothetical protein
MSLLGGAAGSLGARAAAERVRHIGGVLPAAADDPAFQSRLGADLEGWSRRYDASS